MKIYTYEIKTCSKSDKIITTSTRMVSSSETGSKRMWHYLPTSAIIGWVVCKHCLRVSGVVYEACAEAQCRGVTCTARSYNEHITRDSYCPGLVVLKVISPQSKHKTSASVTFYLHER